MGYIKYQDKTIRKIASGHKDWYKAGSSVWGELYMKECKLLNSSPSKSDILVSCENPQKNYKMAIELVNVLRKEGCVAEIDIIGKPDRTDRFRIFILLKNDFYKNSIAEIIVKGKKNTIKLDDFHSFSERLRIRQK